MTINDINIQIYFNLIFQILEDRSDNFNDQFNKKTIFMTGGTGFFGKTMLDYFNWLNIDKGIKSNIIVLSRNPTKFKKQYPHLSNIQFIKGSLECFTLENVNIDYLLHFADEIVNKNKIEYKLKQIENLIYFASKTGCKKLLFTSSGAVYGKRKASTSPIIENDYQNSDQIFSNDAYADGKRMAEDLFLEYGKNSKTDVTIARCFAFVGPYLPLDKHFAIGNFINNKLKNTKIKMTGDGSPYRSYMYSSDLVIWLLTILLKGQNNEIYNVGSDQEITIKNLAREIENREIETSNINPDSHWYVPDISKAKNELGLKVYTDLKSAISKTMIYHQSK